jgi:hypothetical protein
LYNGVEWAQVDCSGSAAQAPDTIHQYSVSNTILFEYKKGQQVSMQWWAGFYNSTPRFQERVDTLSVGPYNNAATEIPWIIGALNPTSASRPLFDEATTTMIMTRIVDTSFMLDAPQKLIDGRPITFVDGVPQVAGVRTVTQAQMWAHKQPTQAASAAVPKRK